MKPGDFPPLKDGEVAILQAEVSTGIVLAKTGERALSGSGESSYLVFPSREEADRFVSAGLLEHPEREYVIYDSTGNFIEVHRNPEALKAQPSPKKRRWWDWWR